MDSVETDQGGWSPVGAQKHEWKEMSYRKGEMLKY